MSNGNDRVRAPSVRQIAYIRALLDIVEKVGKVSPPSSGILHVSKLYLGAELAVDGQRDDVVGTKSAWAQAYFELYRDSTTSTAAFRSPEEVEQIARIHWGRKQVPILLSHLSYHAPEALFAGLIDAQSSSGDPPELPTAEQVRDSLRERRAFFATAYLPDTYREYSRLPEVHHGLAVDFALPASGYLTNTALSLTDLTDLTLDFGDGRGPRPVSFDSVEHVEYSEAGRKVLTLQVRVGTQILRSRFELEVRRAPSIPAHTKWDGLLGSIEVDGKTEWVVGHAWVFLGCGHTKLEAPVIVAEGFPGNNDLEYLWGLLDAEGFATNLLAAGRDLVVVGFEDGTKLIEANAAVVIAAIKRVLMERVGDRKLVVGGASMGGLVSRYALAYMTARGMPESDHIDTYFSFDSPHQGANLPLSVQYLIQVLSREADSMELRKLERIIDSPASQEMLLFWVDEGSRVQNPSWRRQRFLTNLGDFPKTPRRLAVANGAGDGSSNYTPASAQAVHWELSKNYIVLARADLYTATGVAFGNQTPRHVYFSGGTGSGSWYGTPGVPKIDSSPGGTRAFFSEVGEALSRPMAFYQDLGIGGILLLAQADAIVYYEDGSFVPTISALAMPSLSPYDDQQLVRDLTHNPPASQFTSYKFSETNTPHVTITPEILDWLSAQLEIPKPPQLLRQVFAVRDVKGRRFEVFAIGLGGKVFNKYYDCDADGVTCGWSDWSGERFAENDAPPSKAVFAIVNDVASTLEAFLIGEDSQLYHNYYDGAWHYWSRYESTGLYFDGPVASISGAPNTKAQSLLLFMLTPNAELYVNSFDSKWNQWQRLDRDIQDVLAVANSQNRNVEVFAIRRSDEKLLHGYYDGKAWHSFVGDGSLGFAGRALAISAAPNGISGSLEAFMVGADHVLYHAYFNGHWERWRTDREGLKFPSPNVKSVTAVPNTVTNGVEVFVVTTDGTLYHNYFLDGHWDGWKKPSYALAFSDKVSSVVCVGNDRGPSPRLEAFVVSASRGLYHNYLDRSDVPGLRYRWHGWNFWPDPLR